MARVGAAVGSLHPAGAAVQPGRPAAEPATMSSVASYESLVHAVSGAVVSERAGGGGRAAEPLRAAPGEGGRGRLLGGGRWR